MHGKCRRSVSGSGIFWAAAPCIAALLAVPCSAGDEAEKVLRGWVIEAAASGQQVYAFVEVMGKPLRSLVVAAGDDGLQVDAGGALVDVPWGDLSAERLFSLAKRLGEKKTPAEQTALVHFARAKGMEKEAHAEAERLVALDDALNEVLFPQPVRPEDTVAKQPADAKPPVQEMAAPVVPAAGAQQTAPLQASSTLGRYQPVSAALIPQDHPRLCFRKQPFKEVRSAVQALSEAKSGFRGSFSGRLNNWNPAHQALQYLLTNDAGAARRAIELMKKKGRGGWYWAGEWTSQSALAYDWLYDYPGFTKEDKAAAEEAILFGLSECMKGLSLSSTHLVWNGSWICLAGAVPATVALYGHREEATSKAEQALRMCDEHLLALDYLDGTWLEGPTYGSHSLHEMVLAAECFWSATGENPYTRHPGLVRIAQWFAWMTRPDGTMERWDDASGGASCSSNEEYACHILAIARGSLDPVASWYAKWLRDRWGSDAFYPELQAHYLALFAQPEKTDAIARAPERLSEIFGKDTAGFVAARSGWTANDALLTFRSGQNVCPGHQHYCANSFTFYHRAPLAIDSGQYEGNPQADYMKNYTQTSIAHNLVVFQDPAKTDDDGGQAMTFRHTLPRAAELLSGGSWQVGRIIGYEEKGSYMYVAGDAAQAYGGKCKYYVREIVYVRPNTLVILDRTIPGAQRRATWLLHSINEPTVGAQRSAFSVENGGMRMWGTFVIPKDVVIEKVGGKGKEFWNKGRNWAPEKAPGPYHEPGAWRIEAYSTTPGAGWFLAVLESNPKSVPPPQVLPLPDDGNTIGVMVNGRSVIFQRNAPGSVVVR